MGNYVNILGRMTKDADLSYTNTGMAVARFSVALDRGKDKEGNRKADFIPCVAWRGLAEFVVKYFQKGSPIGIEGSLETRKYTDKNGNKVNSVDFIVKSFEFCESKSQNNQQNTASSDGFINIPDGIESELPFK